MLSRLTMALSATSLFGEVIPVKLNHENGSFTGHLNLSITGTMNRAKAEWNGTITNTSSHKLFRAEFCVKALDVSSQQVAPGDQECIINLWGWNWAQGMSLNFNGKQDITSVRLEVEQNQLVAVVD